MWGDCELFGGAASNGILNLTQAAENYDEARNLAADAGHAAVLGCKLVIADWLNNKDFPGSEAIVGFNVDPGAIGGPYKPRALLARQLAQAVLVAGPAPADGRPPLRAFLDQFKLSPAARGSGRREIVEMQLFAAELLLSTDLATDPRSARKDLKYLDALLAVFQGRRGVRPYLRRYYELAVEAYCTAEPAKIDLVQVAHYVLDSRMAHPRCAPARGRRSSSSA